VRLTLNFDVFSSMQTTMIWIYLAVDRDYKGGDNSEEKASKQERGDEKRADSEAAALVEGGGLIAEAKVTSGRELINAGWCISVVCCMRQHLTQDGFLVTRRSVRVLF